MSAASADNAYVTFLLTDIEGSTRLWENEADEMAVALRRHNEIVESEVLRRGGFLVRSQGEGDSTFSVYDDPAIAVDAALGIQLALAAEPWVTSRPLVVRAGLHTGPARRLGDDYMGPSVNRCARVRSAAHGRQTLLSSVTAVAAGRLPVDVSLRDLGEQRLKDLSTPERVFQLCHPALPQDFPPVRGVTQAHDNLPSPLTAIIGRESEQAELLRLIDEQRLVSIIGPGGAGKTRLAVEVAHAARASFTDGSCFVNLAPVAHHSQVAAAVATALGLPAAADVNALAPVRDYLMPRRLLLVLDNCELVRDGVTEVAAVLLGSCRGVRILTTTRRALGQTGELHWRIPALVVPEVADDVETLRAHAGTRLFLERAALSARDWVPVDAEASRVARLCRSLDGIPLAIELAAAQLRTVPISYLVDNLAERSRRAGARSRHETMDSCIDWTYVRLDDEDQRAFLAMSVYPAGIPRSALPFLGVSDAPGIVAELVEHSLVEYNRELDRYRMLEPIRQYAARRLSESGLEAAARERQLQWCLELAEQTSHAAESALAPEIVQAKRELDNLRTGFETTFATNDAARAIRLCVDLNTFFWNSYHIHEAREWAARSLSLTGEADITARAGIMGQLAGMSLRAGDLAEAATRASQALDLQDSTAIPEYWVTTLSLTGVLAGIEGRYADADQIFRRVHAAAKEHSLARSEAVASMNIALISLDMDRVDEAEVLLADAIAAARAIPLPGHAAASGVCVGLIKLRRGDVAAAARTLLDALEELIALDEVHEVSRALEAAALLAATTGDVDTAGRLLGASEAVRARIGTIPWWGTREVDAAGDVVARRLSPDVAEQRRAEGLAATYEEACDLARSACAGPARS